MRRTALASIFAALVASPALSAPSFVAVCKKTGIHRYSYKVDSEGKRFSDETEWADDSTADPYTFRYDSKKNEISLDGTHTYTVFFANDNQIMFGSLDSSSLLTNSHIYALDFSAKTLVYTHSQLSRVLGSNGVMARAISFDCSLTL